MKIKSDGTFYNTIITDDDGKPLPDDMCITKLVITFEARDNVKAVITCEMPEIDISVPDEAVLIQRVKRD